MVFANDIKTTTNLIKKLSHNSEEAKTHSKNKNTKNTFIMGGIISFVLCLVKKDYCDEVFVPTCFDEFGWGECPAGLMYENVESSDLLLDFGGKSVLTAPLDQEATYLGATNRTLDFFSSEQPKFQLGFWGDETFPQESVFFAASDVGTFNSNSGSIYYREEDGKDYVVVTHEGYEFQDTTNYNGEVNMNSRIYYDGSAAYFCYSVPQDETATSSGDVTITPEIQTLGGTSASNTYVSSTAVTMQALLDGYSKCVCWYDTCATDVVRF